MRTQRNPNYKKRLEHEIKPVVFLVVTHLPHDYGYHEKRFAVIKTCLETMRDRAHCDHTFIVWDNGSHWRFRDWLRDEFKPDVIIQSLNFGKGIARVMAIRMLSPETIVCYSDDDIYYEDNWLTPQLKLLRTFPNVAVVSGYPIRTQFQRGIENTLAWARENAELESGLFIPEEWEREHAASIGCGWPRYQKLTKDTIDYRITHKGVQAYAQAHHCQFVGIVGRISKVMNVAMDGLVTPNEWPLDEALDEIGLRLCTTERLCRHIGNVLDESFK